MEPHDQRLSVLEGSLGVNGVDEQCRAPLEYFEVEPVSCTSQQDLGNLIFSPFTGGDQEQLATPWQRLACNGDRPLELTGVLDYVCPEGGIYPYQPMRWRAAPKGLRMRQSQQRCSRSGRWQ